MAKLLYSKHRHFLSVYVCFLSNAGKKWEIRRGNKDFTRIIFFLLWFLVWVRLVYFEKYKWASRYVCLLRKFHSFLVFLVKLRHLYTHPPASSTTISPFILLLPFAGEQREWKKGPESVSKKKSWKRKYLGLTQNEKGYALSSWNIQRIIGAVVAASPGRKIKWWRATSWSMPLVGFCQQIYCTLFFTSFFVSDFNNANLHTNRLL